MAPFALRLLRLGAMTALCWFAIVAEIAPVAGAVRMLPAPDLLFCLLAAAAIRRPGAAPAPFVFALGLLRDLLGGGAVGAGALALVAAIEGLKRVGPGLRRRAFLVEWAAVVAWAAGALSLQTALLALALAPSAPLGDLGMRLGGVALAYPIALLAARVALRLGPREAAAAEGELMFGRRT